METFLLIIIIRYARLAVQVENQTNAQAIVRLDVMFGRKGIRNALQQSLDNAEVIYLSNNKAFIEKGIGIVCMKLSEFIYPSNDCSMITNQGLS